MDNPFQSFPLPWTLSTCKAHLAVRAATGAFITVGLPAPAVWELYQMTFPGQDGGRVVRHTLVSVHAVLEAVSADEGHCGSGFDAGVCACQRAVKDMLRALPGRNV